MLSHLMGQLQPPPENLIFYFILCAINYHFISFPTNNNNNLDAWPQRNHRDLGRGRVDPGLGNLDLGRRRVDPGRSRLDLGRGPESARRPGVAPRSTATVRRLLLAWASEGRIDPRSTCGFSTRVFHGVLRRLADSGASSGWEAPGAARAVMRARLTGCGAREAARAGRGARGGEEKPPLPGAPRVPASEFVRTDKCVHSQGEVRPFNAHKTVRFCTSRRNGRARSARAARAKRKTSGSPPGHLRVTCGKTLQGTRIGHASVVFRSPF